MKKILISCALLLLVGCKQSMFDHIDFSPSPNLESIRVAAVFAKNIQVDFSGIFTIGDYGNAFINPFTKTTNFEIGFLLNTAIINDQNYIHLTPTDVFPNGVSTGIGYAIVEVRSPNPVNEHFDIHAYVDVLKGSWLGAAASFITESANGKLPAAITGLTITQGFLPDSKKQSQVLAAIYGPKKNANGTIAVPGGIAILANVKSLLSNGKLVAGRTLRMQSQPHVTEVQYGP